MGFLVGEMLGLLEGVAVGDFVGLVEGAELAETEGHVLLAAPSFVFI